MVQLADTSPFLYFAVFFFVFSSFWSDLICIRISLTFGFLGLVLAGLSGNNSNGSFANMPLTKGTIDLTTIFNIFLFALNASISYRLIMDEVQVDDRNGDEEEALFQSQQKKCYLNQVLEYFFPFYRIT